MKFITDLIYYFSAVLGYILIVGGALVQEWELHLHGWALWIVCLLMLKFKIGMNNESN